MPTFPGGRSAYRDPGEGYVHDAFMFDGVEELVTDGAPFLAEGLAAGEDVILACTPDHNDALRDALPHDAAVTVLDQAATYRRVTSALTSYLRLTRRLTREPGHRVRVIGEVAFRDEPADWRDWGRYESLCNQTLAPYPLWSVCAYDTRRLSQDVLRSARRTHPYLREPGVRFRNRGFIEPERFLHLVADPPVLPVQRTPPSLSVPRVDGDTDVRQLLSRHLGETLAGRDGRTRDDFALAVHELVVNAVTHGRPPVAITVWTSPEQLVCTVTDHGPGFDDVFAGFDLDPAGGAARPLGLWLARQACDDLAAFVAEDGFTVRVMSRL